MKVNTRKQLLLSLPPLVFAGCLMVAAVFLINPLYRMILGIGSAVLTIAAGFLYFFIVLKRVSGADEPVEMEADQTFSEETPGTDETEGEQKINETKTVEEIDAFFENVSNDILGKAKVVPVLVKQLESVIETTDEAALNLSTSFMNINKQAKAQVSEVSSIFGGLADSSVEDNSDEQSSDSLLQNLKEILTNLVTELKGITAFVKKNQQSIGQITSDIESIRQIVTKIDTITEDSKVLSINAAIEAARAGESGKGFAVVASEFRKLSEDSETAHHEIQSIIDQVTAGTQRMLNEADESLKMGNQIVVKAEGVLEGTVTQIDKAISNTKRKLEDLTEHAQELAKEISKIVVSIQFQDITRQRIEHVTEPLSDFSAELENIANRLKNADTEDFIVKKDHAEWLKGKYTMEDEKQIFESAYEKTEE